MHEALLVESVGALATLGDSRFASASTTIGLLSTLLQVRLDADLRLVLTRAATETLRRAVDDAARHVGRRRRARSRRLLTPLSHRWPVTLSVGAALYAQHSDDDSARVALVGTVLL